MKPFAYERAADPAAAVAAHGARTMYLGGGVGRALVGERLHRPASSMAGTMFA